MLQITLYCSVFGFAFSHTAWMWAATSQDKVRSLQLFHKEGIVLCYGCDLGIKNLWQPDFASYAPDQCSKRSLKNQRLILLQMAARHHIAESRKDMAPIETLRKWGFCELVLTRVSLCGYKMAYIRMNIMVMSLQAWASTCSCIHTFVKTYLKTCWWCKATIYWGVIMTHLALNTEPSLLWTLRELPRGAPLIPKYQLYTWFNNNLYRMPWSSMSTL